MTTSRSSTGAANVLCFLSILAPKLLTVASLSFATTPYLRLRAIADDDAPNVPDGVVCPSFLHPRIRDENVKPFIQAVGLDADGWVAETQRLCGGSGATTQLITAYTGSWDDHTAVANDVRVLEGLFNWTTQYRETHQDESASLTWDAMTGADFDQTKGDARMRSIVGTELAPKVTRALDFGCGSGNDLTSIKNEFGLTKENSLCLDIVEVGNDNVFPILLDHSSGDAYNTSLENVLVGREGSVQVSISVVTFHHISEPRMKRDALQFLFRITAPTGIFVLSDWENQYHPNLWIYYDIHHWLTGLVYSIHKPTQPEDLPQGTEYLSILEYKALVSGHGFRFDSVRSGDIEGAVANSPNRDFSEVFVK